MQFYKHNNLNGIIFTSHGHKYNEPDNTPQDNNSIYGKVLFVDFKSRGLIVFSKGHRLSQGLFVENDLILQTEHGPRGGDEINRIIFQKNYGWPIASYGEPYFREKKSNKVYHFLKNHEEHGFVEPIYSFVPSIGINQIIKIPEKFSYFWKNNFFVTSLEGRKIYRILFDKNYEKVIFHEKIYIGKRTRDIMYVEEFNVFLLALEGSKHSKVGDKFPFIGVMKEMEPE